jgi:hypothetical protein
VGEWLWRALQASQTEGASTGGARLDPNRRWGPPPGPSLPLRTVLRPLSWAESERSLKRVIQKDLVDPIARKLLAGELEDGSVIQVRAGDGALEIGKAKVH